MTSPHRCPCNSGDTYSACCGRFHSAESVAATAAALMQSRFAAFAVGDSAYLLRTWHRSTRPESIELDPQLRWTHLEIVEAVGGGPFDTNGIVEFRAHYRQDRTQSVLHERSTFVREDGQWHYLSGIST